MNEKIGNVHPYKNITFSLHKFSRDDPGGKNYFLSYMVYERGHIPYSSSIHLTENELEQLRLTVGKPAVHFDDGEEWEAQRNEELKESCAKVLEEHAAIYKGKIDLLNFLEKEIKEIKKHLENNKSEDKLFARHRSKMNHE